MTVVNPKSISGITSITTASGSDNLLTIHTSDASNTERVRIDSEGNVIIAESMAVNRPRIVLSAPNDSTNYRHLFGANLQVNSSGTFTTPTANISGGGWEYLAANSLTAHGQIRYLSAPDTNNTTSTPLERVRIDESGRIGIGTDNPNNLLHAYGGQIKAQTSKDNTSTNVDLIRAQSGSSGNALFAIRAANAADNNSSWDIKTNANEDLSFTIGAGSEKVRIKEDGKVGIGSTNPTTTLDVNGTVQVGSAVTISESGIEASGIGITCANINGSQIGGRRNIIINGAMEVAQRGISSTSDGYHTVDRFEMNYGGENEAPTQAQATLTSAAGPYREGHRKAFKITNGNQTGGAGTGDYLFMRTRFEAQDIATSGWDYAQTSSFITLSFWVKSSVAQTFPVRLVTSDGTTQNYAFEYTISSADTWQKVVHTFPGNSNLDFDNNTDVGLTMFWDIFRGTDQTDSSFTNNAWAAFSSSSRTKDQTSTWWTTDDATFMVTGVQLEVGPQATRFEHRTYGDEFSLCQRYYQSYKSGGYSGFNCIARRTGNDTVVGAMHGYPPMRTSATGSHNGTGAFRLYRLTDGSTHTPTSVNISHQNYEPYNTIKITAESAGSYSSGQLVTMYTNAASTQYFLDAEL